jgi:basic membrane protein A
VRRFVALAAVLISWASLLASPAAALEYSGMRLVALYPGVVVDKDFNELGHQAARLAAERLGIAVEHVQRVAPQASWKLMEERILKGANVIWAHGGQFVPAVLDVAAKHPDVSFIAEGETPLDPPLPNVHLIGREYHKGFYVLGALAARVTKTGVVGFVGGQPLPFATAQVNAARKALAEFNPAAELRHVHIGDFNDPSRSRQAAEIFISEGCDVILSGVNMGNFGIIEAVNESPTPVFFTTLYASKQGFSPERFLTADLFDFTGPLLEILARIKDGVRLGFVPMPWGEGRARYTLFPVRNVPPEVDAQMRTIARKIGTGEITVTYDPVLAAGDPH